jgi:hypothetical protein
MPPNVMEQQTEQKNAVISFYPLLETVPDNGRHTYLEPDVSPPHHFNTFSMRKIHTTILATDR